MNHRTRLLISALFLGVATASIGCGETESSRSASGAPDDPLPERPKRPPEIRDLTVPATSSGETTRQRLVIRDAAAWASTWSQLVGSQQPAPPVPEIDFTGNVVVLAAMGTQPGGGHYIVIDDVRIIDGDASISIMERVPGQGCWITAAITNPVAAVVVPRFTGKATFLERTSSYACG